MYGVAQQLNVTHFVTCYQDFLEVQVKDGAFNTYVVGVSEPFMITVCGEKHTLARGIEIQKENWG